jgi:hypothetical protein
VYLLTDPRTGVPFYCGKGQRDRAWQHARAVGRGDLSGNARKVAKIQEILTRGDEVEIQIVAEYEIEDDALEHEFEIVDSLPELTNAMPGGGGGPGGRRLTEQEMRQRASARLARVKALQKKALRERETAAERLLRNRYTALARNEKQAQEIASWLERRGRLVKANRYNGGSHEHLRSQNVSLAPSGRSNRNVRKEREAQLLREGKLIETILPNGKIRLHRAE